MCPKQFEADDKYMICHIDKTTGEESNTESSPSRGKAQRTVDNLNQHEYDNHRPQNYYYRKSNKQDVLDYEH